MNNVSEAKEKVIGRGSIVKGKIGAVDYREKTFCLETFGGARFMMPTGANLPLMRGQFIVGEILNVSVEGVIRLKTFEARGSWIGGEVLFKY